MRRSKRDRHSLSLETFGNCFGWQKTAGSPYKKAVQNQGSVGRKSDKRSRVRQLTDMLWNDRMCSLERQGGRKKLLWPKSTWAY